MPYINRKPAVQKKIPYKHERNESPEFYSTTAWQDLRRTYLMLHPLDEIALKYNKVIPATCVHHKIPFLNGKTDVERWQLFLDMNNLIALSNEVHRKVHKKMKQHRMYKCDMLTEKEFKEAFGDYIDE